MCDTNVGFKGAEEALSTVALRRFSLTIYTLTLEQFLDHALLHLHWMSLHSDRSAYSL